MKLSAKNAAKPWGFTLVELLTVIAIIGVLATLISATLANAQRKGRKAVSTSNLRQISIAFNIYADDHSRRPGTFRELVHGKYIAEHVLLCPEDRIVRNWAGLLEKQDSGRMADPGGRDPAAPSTDYPGAGESVPIADLPHSYFKSFDYIDSIWQDIQRSAMGGIAACQLHGIGRQSKDIPPAIDAYQGLVLRALKDGSVVHRQVYWANNDFSTSINPGEGDSPSPLAGSSQLPLFMDPAE